MTVLAVLAGAVAVALAVPPAPARLRPPPPRSAALRPVLLATALSAASLTVLTPSDGALVAIVGGVGLGIGALTRRRRHRRRAQAVAGRVAECCEALGAELRAGQPPGHALRHAVRVWPPLRPVAECFDLGGDVPGALRALARHPGAGDLRLLAAAWSVAHRTGHGLAGAVERCAAALRADRATRLVVAGELASARSTARLVAGLPLLALAMGAGSGADPFGFLLRSPAGLLCLAAGCAVGLAGLWWLEAIADGVEAGT